VSGLPGRSLHRQLPLPCRCAKRCFHWNLRGQVRWVGARGWHTYSLYSFYTLSLNWEAKCFVCWNQSALRFQFDFVANFPVAHSRISLATWGEGGCLLTFSHRLLVPDSGFRAAWWWQEALVGQRRGSWRVSGRFALEVESASHQWGVLKAVANINDIIAPKLVGMKVTDQARNRCITFYILHQYLFGRSGANHVICHIIHSNCQRWFRMSPCLWSFFEHNFCRDLPTSSLHGARQESTSSWWNSWMAPKMNLGFDPNKFTEFSACCTIGTLHSGHCWYW
jgi:hypothetical protein